MANGLRKLITGNEKQSLQCVIDGEEWGLVNAAKMEFELVEPERITEPERVCWHPFVAEFIGQMDQEVVEAWALLFWQLKKQRWQQRREEKRRRWYERNLPKGARQRMLNPYTCQRCGRCCKNLIIEISAEQIEADLQREPRLAEAVLPFKGPDNEPPHLRYGGNLAWGTGRPCMFLRRQSHGRYGCDIYKTRPEVCRGFFDTPHCREMRGLITSEQRDLLEDVLGFYE